MSWRAAAASFAVSLAAGATPASAGPLHIYIEDNHAGSFYWLARQIDLETSYTLVHFDAHSDASALFDSDKIRTALRHSASLQARQDLLERWRGTGTIQCFNWIEPLMPAPIAKVIWVPQRQLNITETSREKTKATTQLDGHLEAAPRQSGSFRDRYVVSDFENLRETLAGAQPLLVTIDLDYFAGMAAEARAAEFDRIWNFVTAQPALRAVTFAISRPYLKDDNEAHRLVQLTLKAALSLPTASVQFEPFLAVARDRSARARELQKAGRGVASYDVTTAPEALRSLVLAANRRLAVGHEPARWEKLLDTWRDQAPQIHLAVKGAQPSTDGVWRIPARAAAKVELVAEPWLVDLHQIEWFALTPRYSSCNLTALRSDQVGFVANAAPRPVWKETLIAASSLQLPLDDRFFDPKSRTGSVRLRACAMIDGKIRETPIIEVRRFVRTGFRAALSEQFGLPYLFGSGSLSEGTSTGPETNLGADCANFIVYAMRRQGLRVPWSDPKELRKHLTISASAVKSGTTRITEDDLQRGLIVHLGSHAGAVMEDREPVGVLDENDLVAHQLKGLPETLTLGELLRDRNRNSFDLLAVPSADATAAPLLFGGDVMLGRSCAEKIRQGIDPFAGLRGLLERSSFAAANLECTISERTVARGSRYSFRAPAQSARILRNAGFQAVGLANNHALDFGAAGLRECAATLAREQVTPLGVTQMWEAPQDRDSLSLSKGEGRVRVEPKSDLNHHDAYTPKLFPLPNGRKLAALAIMDLPVESEIKGQTPAVREEQSEKSTARPHRASAGIAITPLLHNSISPSPIALASNRIRLQAALEQATAEADFVVCLVHWGTENTNIVTERQRDLARWLVDQGVDLIVGSHPHCVQPLDFYHGRPIAYSLGNLVFDGAPTVPSWNRSALLEIKLSSDAKVTAANLIPVVLKDGLPILNEPMHRVLARQ